MDVTTVFSRAAASQSSYAEGFLPLASLQDTSDKLFTERTGKGVTIDQAYAIAAQLMVPPTDRLTLATKTLDDQKQTVTMTYVDGD